MMCIGEWSACNPQAPQKPVQYHVRVRRICNRPACNMINATSDLIPLCGNASLPEDVPVRSAGKAKAAPALLAYTPR
jgi:hypothetical protein